MTARARIPASLALVVALAAVAGSARADPEAAWVADMARAASAWLGRMGAHPSARLDFGEEARRSWHYVPGPRRGVALREMDDGQREAAWGLVRSGLSSRGIARAEATVALQTALAEMEGAGSRRHPFEYFVTVWGTPGTPPWGWRVEGHHLSVNVTVSAAGRVSVTPLFSGARPARPRGAPFHEVEHRVALELVNSLDARQLSAATIADRAFSDIVAGPSRAQALANPQGLPASQMNDVQRAAMLRLVESYVGLAKDEWGRPYMDLVRAGLPETRFAWAGGRRDGTAFYWRIHGPRVWIEFDHTQGDPNHVHSLWRDPANDFGRDDLGEHYRADTHR